jgi:hypothetical protein
MPEVIKLQTDSFNHRSSLTGPQVESQVPATSPGSVPSRTPSLPVRRRVR